MYHQMKEMVMKTRMVGEERMMRKRMMAGIHGYCKKSLVFRLMLLMVNFLPTFLVVNACNY